MPNQEETKESKNEQSKDSSDQAKSDKARPAVSPSQSQDSAQDNQSDTSSAQADRSKSNQSKPVPSGKFKDIIKQIEELKVADLVQLVKELEDRFGVSPVAPAVGAAPSAGGASAEGEEKTSYRLVLVKTGAQKIAVIKTIREIKPELGLKEAKDLTDAAPQELLQGVKKEQAQEAKAKLEAVGALVELK